MSVNNFRKFVILGDNRADLEETIFVNSENLRFGIWRKWCLTRPKQSVPNSWCKVLRINWNKWGKWDELEETGKNRKK